MMKPYENEKQKHCEENTLLWLSNFRHNPFDTSLTGFLAFRGSFVPLLEKTYDLSHHQALTLYGWVWHTFYVDIFEQGARLLLYHQPKSVSDFLLVIASTIIDPFRLHIASQKKLVIKGLGNFEAIYLASQICSKESKGNWVTDAEHMTKAPTNCY